MRKKLIAARLRPERNKTSPVKTSLGYFASFFRAFLALYAAFLAYTTALLAEVRSASGLPEPKEAVKVVAAAKAVAATSLAV